MTPVRLEPAAPRSRVKYSTTEPLRSLLNVQKWWWCDVWLKKIVFKFGFKKGGVFNKTQFLHKRSMVISGKGLLHFHQEI